MSLKQMVKILAANGSLKVVLHSRLFFFLYLAFGCNNIKKKPKSMMESNQDFQINIKPRTNQ